MKEPNSMKLFSVLLFCRPNPRKETGHDFLFYLLLTFNQMN